MRTKSFFRS